MICEIRVKCVSKNLYTITKKLFLLSKMDTRGIYALRGDHQWNTKELFAELDVYEMQLFMT